MLPILLLACSALAQGALPNNNNRLPEDIELPPLPASCELQCPPGHVVERTPSNSGDQVACAQPITFGIYGDVGTDTEFDGPALICDASNGRVWSRTTWRNGFEVGPLEEPADSTNDPPLPSRGYLSGGEYILGCNVDGPVDECGPSAPISLSTEGLVPPLPPGEMTLWRSRREGTEALRRSSGVVPEGVDFDTSVLAVLRIPESKDPCRPGMAPVMWRLEGTRATALIVPNEPGAMNISAGLDFVAFQLPKHITEVQVRDASNRAPCATSCPTGTAEQEWTDANGCVVRRDCVDADDIKHGPALSCMANGIANGSAEWDHGTLVGPQRSWWYDDGGDRVDASQYIHDSGQVYLSCRGRPGAEDCESHNFAVGPEVPNGLRIYRGVPEQASELIAGLWVHPDKPPGTVVGHVPVNVPDIPHPYSRWLPSARVIRRGAHATVEVHWEGSCDGGHPVADRDDEFWELADRVGVSVRLPDDVETLSTRNVLDAPPAPHCLAP